MSRKTMAAVGCALIAGWIAGAAMPAGHAQQYPRPDPGTGVAVVEGTVNVGNEPTVNVGNQPTVVAMQKGEWSVRLAGGATLRATLEAPSFLEAGAQYAITWPYGGYNPVVYRIGKTREDGWVQATRQTPAPPGEVWINPAQALAVERVR